MIRVVLKKYKRFYMDLGDPSIPKWISDRKITKVGLILFNFRFRLGLKYV
jgi:hypothetical protein